MVSTIDDPNFVSKFSFTFEIEPLQVEGTKLYAAFHAATAAAAAAEKTDDIGRNDHSRRKRKICETNGCAAAGDEEDEEAILLSALTLALLHPEAPQPKTQVYKGAGCCGGDGHKSSSTGAATASGLAIERRVEGEKGAEGVGAGSEDGFVKVLVDALGEDVSMVMSGPAGGEIEHVRAQLDEVMADHDFIAHHRGGG